MNSTEYFEGCRIKSLSTDGQAIDAARSILTKIVVLSCCWIGFHGDFDVVIECEPLFYAGQEVVHVVRSKQARRPTAHENRDQLAVNRNLGEFEVEVSE